MRSSAALMAIINDILDLATIDTGEMALTLGPRRHPRDHRGPRPRACRTGWPNPSCASIIDVPPDIGSMVADGKRIRQVLFNLLSNAIGFSRAGPDGHACGRGAPSES